MKVDELILKLTELRKECENVEVYLLSACEDFDCINRVCFNPKDADKESIWLVGE